MASASTIGGTTTIEVIRWFWISARNCSTSNRGIVTIVAPVCSVALAMQPNPVAWKNGATPSTRPPAPKGTTASCCMTLATQARWVSITPFGRPLVPLE